MVSHSQAYIPEYELASAPVARPSKPPASAGRNSFVIFGLANPTMIADHLDASEKGLISTDTLDGNPSLPSGTAGKAHYLILRGQVSRIEVPFDPLRGLWSKRPVKGQVAGR